jgi:ABC-type multidrug transport system ATPase subunit/ABC-type multidrug transport system permease subunit
MTITDTLIELDRRQEREPHRAGLRIDAHGLVQILHNGRRVLEDVSLSIEPGSLVAIVGGSGAGKSTLLDALAGTRPASHGTVHLDGVDAQQRPDARSTIGYVPQDDIIHRDLPLATTLRYAAQLRLPTTTTRDQIDALVRDTLATLGLDDRADVPVGKLSGGQRKRASIGVELLTRPRAFFLDEPTSGLDPATAQALMRTLRRLADAGTTVVLTTHNTADLRHCDRVVYLAAGGRLAYDSPLDDAKRDFGTDDVSELYELLAQNTDREPPPTRGSTPDPEQTPAARGMGVRRSPSRRSTGGPSALRQWIVLTRRNLALLGRNRLTLAITFGSPLLVIAMLAVLFRPGTFDPTHPDTDAASMVAFWIAFAAFFFGLTFGLLQIVTEMPILRRERFVGLDLRSYLAAKLTVLVPVLTLVVAAMVAVLTSLDRLPSAGTATIAPTLTLIVAAIAAAALGLLASAAVADPAQATLALPMLCFPAVLFSGAVVPTEAMTTTGKAISVITPNRWTFEAVGGQLLRRIPSTASHADLLTRADIDKWLVLGVFAAIFLAAAHTILRRRSNPTPNARP